MKITQHIKIEDRESLAQVSNHVANECIESRLKTKYLYQTFFEKWDLEKVSFSLIKSVSSNWVNESVAAAIASFSTSMRDKTTQRSWYGQLFTIMQQLAPLLWNSLNKKEAEVETEIEQEA
jgi:hypothetical protein